MNERESLEKFGVFHPFDVLSRSTSGPGFELFQQFGPARCEWQLLQQMRRKLGQQNLGSWVLPLCES